MKTGDIFDDKFEILDVIGSGGVGTVFKSLQLDCNRVVALKVLHPNTVLDEEYRARFFREAQALSLLSHMNIVTVYHLGITSTFEPYLVMEYLEGQSLRAVLNNVNRLPVLEALRITRDAARALQYSHQQGVVHRDLKPENMILVAFPEPNTLKLVDFGLAKLFGQESREQNLTSTGELIGTSAYMSPEQCMGKTVDFRTDIYSLSACLYEMMVGQRAMDADTNIGLMYKQINEPAPDIKPGQVNHFDPVLNDIISRGMVKAPQNRFLSMEEMADALDRALTHLQSALKVRAARHYPALAIACTTSFAAIGATILLLLAYGSNGGWNSKRIKHPEALVLTRQDKISRQIGKCEARLSHWRDPSTIQSPVQKERYLNELFALARSQLSSPRLEDKAAAEKTYNKALLFCRHDGEGQHRKIAACIALRAKSEWDQGKFDSAEADFKKAVNLSSQSHDYELLSDILAERVLFELHVRKLEEARADILLITKNLNKIPREGPLLAFRIESVLDKDDETRLDKTRRIFVEFRHMRPQSVEETVLMVEFSIAYTQSLLALGLKEDARESLLFSQVLLSRLEDHEELRQQTRDLSARCGKRAGLHSSDRGFTHS